jgi:hypothetical protein
MSRSFHRQIIIDRADHPRMIALPLLGRAPAPMSVKQEFAFVCYAARRAGSRVAAACGKPPAIDRSDPAASRS